MNVNWILKNGIIGGVVAGIVFALVEMVNSFILRGQFFGPLKMIASIPLAQQPLNIDLTNAIVFGLFFHLLLSSFYGVIVAFVIDSTKLRRSGVSTVLFSTLAGFVIWVLNFYVFAPLVDALYFRTNTNALLQFIFHTFMFGTVLGIYLAYSRNKKLLR